MNKEGVSHHTESLSGEECVLFVSGSRVFYVQRVFDEDMKQVIARLGRLPSLLIHGGDRGADRLANKWAEKNKIPVKPFYPEYEKYGQRLAPLIRNKEMAALAHFFVAFPTKESRGTRHAIAQVKLPKECVMVFEK